MNKRLKGLAMVGSSLQAARSSMTRSALPADRHVDIRRVPLTHMHADPDQPRRSFDEAAITTLADSIKSVGLLQPPLLRPHPTEHGHWYIRAGERRWRAMAQLGWTETDAICLAEEYDKAEIALIENLQRVDLTPFEISDGIIRLLETQQMEQKDLAAILGSSRSDVSRYVALRKIIPEIRDGAVGAELARGTLFELASLSADQQQALWQERERTPLTILSIRAAKTAGGATGPGAIPAPAPASAPARPAPALKGEGQGEPKPLRVKGWRAFQDRVAQHQASGKPLSAAEKQAVKDLIGSLRELLGEGA